MKGQRLGKRTISRRELYLAKERIGRFVRYWLHPFLARLGKVPNCRQCGNALDQHAYTWEWVICQRCDRVLDAYHDIYDYDEYEDDDWGDEYDAWEEALQECGQIHEGGSWYCLNAGTEYCDFECPFRDEVYGGYEDGE